MLNLADELNALQLGMQAHQAGQWQTAVQHYQQTLQLNPNNHDAHHFLGIIALVHNNFTQAAAHVGAAIALYPHSSNFFMSLGTAYDGLHQTSAALASYSQALALDPNNAQALCNRGNTYAKLFAWPQARQDYSQALVLKPDYPEAHVCLANVYVLRKNHAQAAAHYQQAHSYAPSMNFVLESWLFCKLSMCDWSGLDMLLVLLKEQIAQGALASRCFPLLHMFDEPQLHKKAAQTLAGRMYPANASLGPLQEPEPKPLESIDKKIVIGYFSADFHHHATAYLMSGLIEQHDRTKFKIIGFSFGEHIQDTASARLALAFDGLHQVQDRTDADIASLARSMGVGIAVDLKGFTRFSRPGIFAHRCAGLQVSYLGYPGTTGAPYMDYIVADHRVIGNQHLTDFSEKVIFLPGCYQVNDATRAIASTVPTRQASGLPTAGFVFCCFNTSPKILPDMFAAWMRLLLRVPGSVLWLVNSNTTATENLKLQAVEHGIDPARLVFAAHLPQAEHLARHRLADLFLDTFPCNAHTTASDALWADLPVLTLCGQCFASRVAASLLTSLKLDDLITHTLQAYEAKAYKLATDSQALATIKAQLTAQKLVSDLFDTAAFTRHLEAAYASIDQRHKSRLPPAHLAVARLQDGAGAAWF